MQRQGSFSQAEYAEKKKLNAAGPFGARKKSQRYA